MKRVLVCAAVVLAAGGFIFLTTGANQGSAAGTYKIEFDDAFGLVTGANFEVAGVPAGSITNIGLDTKTLHALVTVQVTKSGFGQFHSNVSCQTRPESLIGEYYVDCNPGTAGAVIKPGSTIPVTHTTSTIPADLLQNIMRLPYRERFTILINELGATAAARGGDLKAALQRAVPALTETDSLLNLLGNDSTTLQALTRDSNTVITALANNSANVNRFITEAGRTAATTATQQGNLRTSLARLPGLLQQLKPTLAQLSATVTTNTPVLQNLNASSGQINRLFTDLPPFSRSARPAIKALGQASVTGKAAVTAAEPTVADLNRFAKRTPDLAGNLAIVGGSLDTQKNAVEPDKRSPGGKGFSGLQALLWYVFNQTLAVNTYGPLGHVLAVDAFFSPECTPYATPASIALMLKQYGSSYRQCYSWLGPNQPGVNEPDPSDPNAPVPDPGGAPPGQKGPTTDARRLTAAEVQAARTAARQAKTSKRASSTTNRTSTTQTTSSTTSKSPTTSSGASNSPTASNSPSASNSPTSTSATTTTTRSSSSPLPAAPGAPPINLKQSVGQILSGIVGGGSSSSASSSSGNSSSSSNTSTSSQAQQLLNYLLAP